MTIQDDKNANVLSQSTSGELKLGLTGPGPSAADAQLARDMQALRDQNTFLRAAIQLLPGAANVNPEVLVRDAKIWCAGTSDTVQRLQREAELLHLQVSEHFTERDALVSALGRRTENVLNKRETFAAFVLMGLASRIQPIHVTKDNEQGVVVKLAFKMADLAIEQCKE
jgi:hypothetical protein